MAFNVYALKLLINFGWQVTECRAQWETIISGFRISWLGFEETHGFMSRDRQGFESDKSEWALSGPWMLVNI